VTTIFSVLDASILRSQQEQPGPPPAQDFAQELAKHPSQAKPSSQDNQKTATYNGFDQEQTFKPVQAEPVATANKISPQTAQPIVVDQTIATEQHAAVVSAGVTETLLEARVFGWHAMAQAYLSELSTADGHAEPHEAMQSDQALAAIQKEAMSETPTAIVIAAAPVAAEESSTAAQVGVLSKAQAIITLDDAASANAVEPPVADAFASGFWPERSLRFTRQRDGSSVAWLRDFRLGDAEASHLIRFVLSDARQKGVVLSRIMLNGREVWTSPSIS
jgi:hypothetical protein